MQMTALAPHCGVEIRGVQLAEATGDAALLDEIRTAVWEHGVALLRDQDFGPQEHIAFARAFDVDWKKMNNFGSSLVWGHPQGPTGLRALIEMIEELVIRGGGTGLFQGCAAGDSAMAVILRVR